jgi:hypothetical protein
MNISEFKKERSWTCWTWNQRVNTPLAAFRVQLQIDDEEDKTPPDDEMLSRAAALVSYAQSNGDYILDLVFGDFRRCLRSDPVWLDVCEIPRDVTRDGIRQYVTCCALVVHRQGYEGEIYGSEVHVVGRWDEEHTLDMQFRDGAIVTVDELPFELRDGVLVFPGFERS